MRIEDTVGATRDGGSCANCGRDYQGAPYSERRGRRVLAEIEPGVVEPVNICQGCHDAQEGDL